MATAKRAAARTTESAGDSVRERVLATARDLFYREGARAIGVDRIVAESGVAKTSMYRWFPSKDELIAAFLQAEVEQRVKAWEEFATRYKGRPVDLLRAQVSRVAKHIASTEFRGCPFINVATEFPDAEHPARGVCRLAKDETRRALREVAAEAGVKDPESLADQLSLLIDGAMASAQVLGKSGPAAQFASTANALIDAHLSTK